MARITLTIEDKPNGNVSVIADPTFETMIKMNISGDNLTSAHGYALSCINHIRRLSKSGKGDLIAPMPKLKGLA